MAEYKGWPHALISGYGCDKRALGDVDKIYKFLKHLPAKMGMKALGHPIIFPVYKEDHPDTGVTAIQIIATSHISIHTFPQGQKNGRRKPRGIERKVFQSFFCMDLFSCKEFDLTEVLAEINKIFKPKTLEVSLVHRLREDSSLIDVENIELTKDDL